MVIYLKVALHHFVSLKCTVTTTNGSHAPPTVTSRKLFWFLSFWLINYLHRFWSIFDVNLTLGLNMEFVISQPKMVRLSRNEKQTYWMKSRPKIRPSGVTLTMTLTLNFLGQLLDVLYLMTNGSDCPERKINVSNWKLSPKTAVRFEFGHDIDLGSSMSNFLNSCISVIARPIDVK